MQVLTLETGPEARDDFLGTVICQTVSRSATDNGIALRKGQIVQGEDLSLLRSIERQVVRVIRMEDGDLHEDAASRHLARAVAGPGLSLQGPAQGRVNLVATWRGIAVIDFAALVAVNLVPDVSVFTVLPYQPVRAGDVVAGAKVVPLVTRASTVSQVERLGRAHGPIIQVKPFLPLRVGVVSKQRPNPRPRERFESQLRRKLAWFGASLLGVQYVGADVEAATSAFADAMRAGADLILTAGSSSADPLDSFLVAIEALGGSVEVRGTPTHPGSFFWLACLDGGPVFGMPSCGAYSESTVVDLLLLRVMAGLRPTRADVAELGAGGLFGRATEALFPTYDLAEDPPDAPAVAGSAPG